MNDKVLNKVIELATNGALAELLDKKGEILVESVLKTNGVNTKCIIFRPDGENVAPSVNLSQFSGSDPFEIIRHIAGAINEALGCGPSTKDVGNLSDTEYIKKNARIRIVNMVSNKEFLSDIPYKNIWGDLAAYVTVAVAIDGTGEGSYAFNNKIMQASGVSFDEIYDIALSNNREDICVRSMGEIFGMLGMGELDFMKVISNSSGYYGASALLGHEKEYDGFYVIPASVHELILLPKAAVDPMQAMGLGNMIRDVNCSTLEDVDILSDHPYLIVNGVVEAVA